MIVETLCPKKSLETQKDVKVFIAVSRLLMAAKDMLLLSL